MIQNHSIRMRVSSFGFSGLNRFIEVPLYRFAIRITMYYMYVYIHSRCCYENQ